MSVKNLGWSCFICIDFTNKASHTHINHCHLFQNIISISIYAPITSCLISFVWTSPSCEEGQEARIFKMKIYGFKPITFHTTSWCLTPLGHSERWWAVFSNRCTEILSALYQPICRVGGDKTGSVGLAETQLYFLGLAIVQPRSVCETWTLPVATKSRSCKIPKSYILTLPTPRSMWYQQGLSDPKMKLQSKFGFCIPIKT